MKTQWQQRGQVAPPVVVQKEIERELPKLQPNFLMFECLYGPHKADLLHRGTAYCRSCYDERNQFGKLIDS